MFFLNEKFWNLIETKILGKSFSLNPEWNKQKENEYLLTIVFLFHAIIGETQSESFYVTHALPIKIRTNSIFILFDLSYLKIQRSGLLRWFIHE